MMHMHGVQRMCGCRCMCIEAMPWLPSPTAWQHCMAKAPECEERLAPGCGSHSCRSCRNINTLPAVAREVVMRYMSRLFVTAATITNKATLEALASGQM